MRESGPASLLLAVVRAACSSFVSLLHCGALRCAVMRRGVPCALHGGCLVSTGRHNASTSRPPASMTGLSASSTPGLQFRGGCNETKSTRKVTRIRWLSAALSRAFHSRLSCTETIAPRFSFQQLVFNALTFNPFVTRAACVRDPSTIFGVILE